MKIHVFWDVTTCRLNSYERFEEQQYLHLQGEAHKNVIRNVGNYLPFNTAQYPKKIKSLATPLITSNFALATTCFDLQEVIIR